MTDIKNLWQGQKTEDEMITLSDIHARVGKFRGRIRWRNILIGGYAVLSSIMLCRWLLFQVSHKQLHSLMPSIMLPAVILWLVANLWILFALWWRGRARALPSDLAAEAALDFHRHELERQCNAAASAWAWYILPFMPPYIYLAWKFSTVKIPGVPPFMLFYVFVPAALFFLAVWLAFSRSAARLELELERFKRLRAE